MSKINILKTLAEDNLGYLKVSDAVAAGLSRTYISRYVETNGFERVADGLYLAPDAWPDGMYVIQARYPQAVFSHETALYLLGMAEREPTQYTITLKAGASTSRLAKEGFNVIITGRRKEKLEEMEKEIRDISPDSKVLALNFDVRVYNEVEANLGNLPAEWKHCRWNRHHGYPACSFPG